MATNIIHKKSSVAGKQPNDSSDLVYGELAINYQDGYLYYKDTSNAIRKFMDSAKTQALIDKFNGGPVGVNSLSVAVSEDVGTIEDVYEPYLIKEGFIQRTNRGRIAQRQAYDLLGRTITEKQQRLFE